MFEICFEVHTEKLVDLYDFAIIKIRLRNLPLNVCLVLMCFKHSQCLSIRYSVTKKILQFS